MSDKSIFGYYDAPGQAKPAYDPGRDVLCPFCMKMLGDGDIRFMSLLLPSDNRSYFYSYHFGCYEEKAANEIEGALIDTRAKKVGEGDNDRAVMEWLQNRNAVPAVE